VIAVSVALAFQALLFGDGGVLVYAVNCVNMAIVLPFVAYGVYRLLSGRAALASRRRVIAAGVGAYIAINVSALAAAVELGIQPGLFHTADGAPLYSPYHLSQTIPAMALPHLTVAGAAEAILTGAVLAYLQRADIARLVANHRGVALTDADVVPRPTRLSPARVALTAMVLMALLTPLGLLAPGGAFGEDAPQQLDLHSLGLSTVPAGLDRYNGFWSHTLLGGYGFSNGDHADVGYILSALVGIIVVGTVVYAISKVFATVSRNGRGRTADAETDDQRPHSHV
jgi:cobalt/nickel transport system permease protein